MTDVLSEALNQKVFSLLSASDGKSVPGKALPLFLALLLFLTLLSFGAVLVPLWLMAASALVCILIRLDVFRIVRIPAEREILE